MSVFSETTVQENRPDDYSAPPQSKDVVESNDVDGPEKPPNCKPIMELSDVKECMAVSSPIEQKYYADSSEFEDNVSIKDEVVDLGNETYLYDDKKYQFKILPKKVGFDRVLEPDRIVGATEENGKLMFLIAWKNSVDVEADLLEANEIHDKFPQLAIDFYEKHIAFVLPDKSDKKKH